MEEEKKTQIENSTNEDKSSVEESMPKGLIITYVMFFPGFLLYGFFKLSSWILAEMTMVVNRKFNEDNIEQNKKPFIFNDFREDIIQLAKQYVELNENEKGILAEKEQQVERLTISLQETVRDLKEQKELYINLHRLIESKTEEKAERRVKEEFENVTRGIPIDSDIDSAYDERVRRKKLEDEQTDTRFERQENAMKMLVFEAERRFERAFNEQEKKALIEKHAAELVRITDKVELSERIREIVTDLSIFKVGVDSRFTLSSVDIKMLAAELNTTKRELNVSILEHKHWTGEQILNVNQNVMAVVDQLGKFANQFESHKVAVDRVLMQAQHENWDAQRLNGQTQTLISGFEQEKKLIRREMEVGLLEVSAINKQATTEVMRLFFAIDGKSKEIAWQIKEFDLKEEGGKALQRAQIAERQNVEQRIEQKQQMLETTEKFINEKIGWREEKNELIRRREETEDQWRERWREERQKRIDQKVQNDIELRDMAFSNFWLEEELRQEKFYK